MRTFVTDRRTDRQTDGPGYIGPEGGSKKGSEELNANRQNFQML